MKSPWSNTPCLKCTKNPVLLLALPLPSSLWTILKGNPAVGVSSIIELLSNPVETKSKSKLSPSTFFVKE